MSLNLPNLDREQKKEPPLGEALQKVQTYVNANVAVVVGNKVAPPTFVTPGQRQG
jgi:hypothetical protein